MGNAACTPTPNPSRKREGSFLAWVAVLLLAFFLAVPAFAAAPVFPPLTGRVTDAAAIIPADTAAALDTRLAALETATGTQLVVATVADLQGYEIEEYGYQLGRAWGIGQKGKNTGAILLVAPKERKVRIEVGYGLEGVLTDAVTRLIIENNIVPAFKQGDMPGGIVAGTDALVALLQLPADQQQAAAQQAAAQGEGQRGSSSGKGFGTIVWIVIIVIWLLSSVLRGRRGRRSGSAIIWGPGLGGWGGGGGGWGGGGGGGFGGGGGSFGGGGSSGSW